MREYMSSVQCEPRVSTLRRGSFTRWPITLAALALLAGATGISAAQEHDSDDAFLPSPVRSASTVPANGDLNPYGVAFVPHNFQTGSGPLKHGDILVSNFNNSANLQGTGTTIVRIPANGSPKLFFQGKTGIGLSTALGTLQYGFVVVGNSPSTDGTSANRRPRIASGDQQPRQTDTNLHQRMDSRPLGHGAG
jgi:hypothetical protein